jgi:L-ascorbate metabolism protein UlaG (beta-lactamase superfamily)
LQKHEKAEAIRQLYTIPLAGDSVGLIFLEYSAVILRLPDATIGMDLGKSVETNQIQAIESLDLLLHSHTHYDHYQPRVIRQILKVTSPRVLVEPMIAKELEGKAIAEKVTAIHPGEPVMEGQFEINAITGVHPRPITLFHVQGRDVSVFHGGDSGYVPLKEYRADLAILPCGMPSPSCTTETALQMAQDLQPKVVLVVHGRDKQRLECKRVIERELPSTRVHITRPFEPITLKL